jgi:hypothetical protein
MSYPKKNNKNINRASKNKILATAHASFGNPFTFMTANFVPKRRGVYGSSARSVPQRGTSLRPPPSLFSPSGRETLPAQSSTDFLTNTPRLGKRRDYG